MAGIGLQHRSYSAGGWRAVYMVRCFESGSRCYFNVSEYGDCGGECEVFEDGKLVEKQDLAIKPCYFPKKSEWLIPYDQALSNPSD